MNRRRWSSPLGDTNSCLEKVFYGGAVFEGQGHGSEFKVTGGKMSLKWSVRPRVNDSSRVLFLMSVDSLQNSFLLFYI